jgi:hypothetical protein
MTHNPELNHHLKEINDLLAKSESALSFVRTAITDLLFDNISDDKLAHDIMTCCLGISSDIGRLAESLVERGRELRSAADRGVGEVESLLFAGSKAPS